MNLEHLPLVEAPESVWISLEAKLRERPRRVNRTRLAFACAAIAFTVTVAWWQVSTRSHWIETNATSSTTLKIANIGLVEVLPNTRLRVVADRAGEHRLSLAHGRIHATISAPRRLFFVDTAAGTAIDLGCDYSLTADDNGSGVLRVARGWVSYQWKGMESLVPAGASCRTHTHNGVGTPYFDDASDPFKRAVDRFDEAQMSLDTVLATARVRDTLTLWHVISRVGAGDRAQVFDRIAALTPLPADVARERVLTLDAETLKRWREELAWTW